MKTAIPVLLLLTACGGSLGTAPAITVAEECAQGDLHVQVEAGLAQFYNVLPTCADLLKEAQTYREVFEERFGHLDLSGIPIRYRAVTYIDADKGFTGMTYGNAIDLAVTGRADVPHELNHVRTGASHDGWCVDFEPWSESVLGIDQRTYLGCP